jgi:hypothetical protein
MNPITISPEALRRAANIQEQIEALQQKVRQILAGQVESPVTDVSPVRPAATTRAGGARKKMSAQGVANIRAGVVKRVAAYKAALAAAALAAATPTSQRKGNSAAKARLSAKARGSKAKRFGK